MLCAVRSAHDARALSSGPPRSCGVSAHEPSAEVNATVEPPVGPAFFLRRALERGRLKRNAAAICCGDSVAKPPPPDAKPRAHFCDMRDGQNECHKTSATKLGTTIWHRVTTTLGSSSVPKFVPKSLGPPDHLEATRGKGGQTSIPTRITSAQSLGMLRAFTNACRLAMIAATTRRITRGRDPV
jgi:hypothetical protein